ncbi:hypothetical protein EBX31_05375 [bacterium]|nr:hypothetical protein [bacterium]
MISPRSWFFCAILLCLHGLSFGQNVNFQAGERFFTPNQLHDLFVGKDKRSVVQFFGRPPDQQQGFDWIYTRLPIYYPDEDRYLSVAVFCFSHADDLVWQVVCYP